MNDILKTIKQDFLSLNQEKKIRIKHKNYGNYETLMLLPTSNTKAKEIVISFVYFLNEKGLDVKITFKQSEKNQENKTTSFAFSNTTKDINLPFVDEKDQKELKNMFKYELIENKIQSVIKAEDQKQVFVRVIKDNLNSIINYINQL
jgi:hypothetical protein